MSTFIGATLLGSKMAQPRGKPFEIYELEPFLQQAYRSRPR